MYQELVETLAVREKWICVVGKHWRVLQCLKSKQVVKQLEMKEEWSNYQDNLHCTALVSAVSQQSVTVDQFVLTVLAACWLLGVAT